MTDHNDTVSVGTLTGEVVLVTGATRGIGPAAVAPAYALIRCARSSAMDSSVHVAKKRPITSRTSSRCSAR